jgi:Protein of unknown function (DUF3037)
MNNSTKPAKGYYSILQYIPNLERAEGANLGVVLFCPEKRFLNIKMAGGNDRVRRFFDTENLDLGRLNAMKTAFSERIRQQADVIVTPEDFKLFIETRANQMVLTEPRPMKVFDPREDLESLCEKLVGGRHKTEQQAITKQKIIKQFDEVLQKRELSPLIKKNVQIELPLLHRTETYAFSYQNGQPNLIKPVVFGSDENQTFAKSCRLAVEGDNLSDKNYKLNVLAGFDSEEGDNRQTVRDILGKYDVNLYFTSQIDELADYIKETAHL